MAVSPPLPPPNSLPPGAHPPPKNPFSVSCHRNSHNEHRKYKQYRRHLKRHSCHQDQYLPGLELKIPLLAVGALYPRLQSLYTHVLPPSSSCCLPCPPSTLPPPPPSESSILKYRPCLCHDHNQKHHALKHCRCRRHHQHNKEEYSKKKEKEKENGITALLTPCQARERQHQQKNDIEGQSQRYSSAASWKWQKKEKQSEREEEWKEEVEGGMQSRDPRDRFLDYPSDFNLCALHRSTPSPLPPPVPPPSPPPACWRPDGEEKEDGQALVRGLEEEISKLFLQSRDRRRRRPPATFSSPSPSALLHRKQQVLQKLSTLASPTTSPLRQQETRMRRIRGGYEGPPWVPP